MEKLLVCKTYIPVTIYRYIRSQRKFTYIKGQQLCRQQEVTPLKRIYETLKTNVRLDLTLNKTKNKVGVRDEWGDGGGDCWSIQIYIVETPSTLDQESDLTSEL